MLKVKTTDTHVYFVNGPFSQWEEAAFMENGEIFNCAEQYMMAGKARYFGDEATRKKIMSVGVPLGKPFSFEIPKAQKALGREVKPFVLEQWTKEVACDIVTRGNILKFTQNPDIRKLLVETDDRYLVEGASYDPVWGVGLAWDDPLILDERNWKGTNWLGECLMKVRSILHFADAVEEYAFA